MYTEDYNETSGVARVNDGFDRQIRVWYRRSRIIDFIVPNHSRNMEVVSA